MPEEMSLAEKIYAAVRLIPRGKVATYRREDDDSSEKEK